jgi:two-component system OmpR family response regulator
VDPRKDYRGEPGFAGGEVDAVDGRIVVVDDDPVVRRVVVRLLIGQGLQAVALSSADELRARLALSAPDLLILDVSIGDDDGMALARELRATSSMPILMLTGHTTVFDKVAGLESGADDYLTKPFDGQELIARVHALLRRAARAGARDAAAAGTWRFAGWTLREVEHDLFAPDASAVMLTSHEFRLLSVLVHRAGRPLDRDAMSQALAGRGSNPTDRSGDVMVGKLRRKLAAHGGGELIKTVRGVGYVLATQAERDA